MDKKKIARAVKMIIEAIGEDPSRADLVETPRRVGDMLEEILAGTGKNPAKELEVFLSEDHDEIVLVKDIALYSVCEHHLLPFIGKVHVAYLPKNNRITGLSKIARVVDLYSKRLQVQERLTSQIADTLMKTLDPMGALVVIEAEHLCMSMRGIKKPGTTTVTSAVRGIFKKDPRTRAEAMALIGKN